MHASDFLPGFLLALPVLILIAIWTVIIKGYTLWKAARHGDKAWFIAILILNTLGILELVYLVWFAGKKNAMPAVELSSASTPEA